MSLYFSFTEAELVIYYSSSSLTHTHKDYHKHTHTQTLHLPLTKQVSCSGCRGSNMQGEGGGYEHPLLAAEPSPSLSQK